MSTVSLVQGSCPRRERDGAGSGNAADDDDGRGRPGPYGCVASACSLSEHFVFRDPWATTLVHTDDRLLSAGAKLSDVRGMRPLRDVTRTNAHH